MIKVLFFLESLGGGGAEKVLVNLIKGLDKSKYNITVKVMSDVGVYNDEIAEIIKCKSIISGKNYGKNIFHNIFYKIKYKLIYLLPKKIIYKIIAREKYDVEVAFIEGFATAVISESKNKLSKKIAWIHVDPIERNYADGYFKNLEEHSQCYKKFDKIVCVSKSVERSAIKKYGITLNNIMTQYNPIDEDDIKKRANEKINILDSSAIKFITIGRLVEQKGYDRLIRVIKRLKEEYDGVFQLLILGDGEKKKQLGEYIKENKLTNIVKLQGFVKNPYPYLKNSDLFICSSRAEGYSLVIAESLILNVPVISTKCSGPNELLDFGKYGMLVENDEDSLYLGLKNIIDDRNKLKELKKKSQKRSEIFNYKKTIERIEKKILDN